MNKRIKTIVFSKDRPMQLYAMLESFFLNCKDIDICDIIVSYRGCEESIREYKNIASIFDGKCKFEHRTELKSDLPRLISSNNLPFIMFLVDDIIFKENFNIESCVDFLESNPSCFTFSLRLGRGLNYCYPCSHEQSEPFFFKKGKILIFAHSSCEFDYGYPFSIDGNIYRHGQLASICEKYANYSSPNHFEGSLALKASIIDGFTTSCFETPVLLNIPHNRVQDDVKNRSEMNSFENLIDKWRDGYKIDISKIQGLKNNSCHFPIELEFVKR